MKRCAEWQKRLSQFKQHRRTLTVYWGKQDFRCSKSRNVSLKFSCRIWFGILCETSIKKKVIWSAKLICLPRVIFWTNWKTTLIVIRSYAFFPALSQWWGYVYLHCVSIGSLKFLPLLWLAAITWLKMVFLRSIQHWRVIATARRNQTLSSKAREEHRQ